MAPLHKTPWRPDPLPPQMGLVDRSLRPLARLLPSLPEAVLRLGVGAPRRNRRGDALDVDTQVLLTLKDLTQGEPGTVDARREDMRRGISIIDGARVPVGGLVEAQVAGVRVRIYKPASVGPWPYLMYLHGGGWVTGDLDSHDRFCRRLCTECDVLVVAVDYRLAPEAPFPAALEDAAAVWAALPDVVGRHGGDPARGAVGGDSAGGNLSAVLCRHVRDGRVVGPTPMLQLLIYPATDFRMLTDSHKEFALGYLLTEESILAYKALYAAPDDDDPDVSPLLAPDVSRLPPAVVTTAGFDPLRDEGDLYAARLAEAGVAVDHLEHGSLVHGYVQMDSVSRAAGDAVTELLQAVRRRLHQG